MPDMYTEHFTCAMAKEVPFETLEGYELTVTFVKSLANYLTKHGWEKRVLFHIHDEPDIHYQTQEVLEARKRQYYLAAGILRKYIPGIRIIEAVDSAEFRGGIDIWVPGTAGYEKKKEEFDTLIRLGAVSYTHLDVYKRQGYASADIEKYGLPELENWYGVSIFMTERTADTDEVQVQKKLMKDRILAVIPETIVLDSGNLSLIHI